MPLLSDSARKGLESNVNVEKVSKSFVSYTLKFKLHALKSYERGNSPKQIFIEAGIDLGLFRFDYAKNTIRRWRRIGIESLKLERRGKSNAGRQKKKNLSQEQEIEQLKAEIWILKKLQALAKKQKK
jgi:hypothetical protein